MNKPETLAILDTQDTGLRKRKKNHKKHNAETNEQHGSHQEQGQRVNLDALEG